MENTKEKEPRKLKRKKAGAYGLAKRRGVEREDWDQERMLQAFLVIGAWNTELPEPEQRQGEEEPALWAVLDRIDDNTLASCMRLGTDARMDIETLDQLLANDRDLVGLDELPPVVELILAVVPRQLQSYVAEAYLENNPLPKNIAALVATYLWQIDELLPKHWRKMAQMSRCIVTVR